MNNFITNNQNLKLAINIDLTKTELVKKNRYSALSSEMEKLFIERDIAVKEYRDFKNQFKQYKEDPLGFFKEIIKYEKMTLDREAYLEILAKERIIVAKVPSKIGTTHFINQLALWHYISYEGSRVFITCPPPNSNFNFGALINLQDKYKHLFSYSNITGSSITGTYDVNNSIDYLTVPQYGNRSERIAKFSGKFAKNHLFIIDRANAMPTEILETMEIYRRIPTAKILYFYNENHANKEANNKFLELTKDFPKFQFSIFNHPNVCYGKEEIPGAINQEKVKEYILKYSRPCHQGEFPDFTIPYDMRTMFLEIGKQDCNRIITEETIKNVI